MEGVAGVEGDDLFFIVIENHRLKAVVFLSFKKW